jgi:hypothetical protein
MSEDDKLAYIYYVAGCLRIDQTPLYLLAWKNLYNEFKLKESEGK